MLRNLTSGLSWQHATEKLKQLARDLTKERQSLPALHAPLIDVSKSKLQRAGRAGENTAAVQLIVKRCRDGLERLIEREEYLGSLIAAISAAQSAAAAGELTHDQDWTALINEAVADAQTQAYHDRLKQSKQRALQEFDEACWRVHHADEAMAGHEDEPVAVGGGELSAAELLDPFTRDFLVEPLRARHCGHRYSKASIEQFLLERQKRAQAAAGAAPAAGSERLREDFAAPCQHAGCKHKVSMDSLVPDSAAARAVLRAQAAEQRGSSADGAAAAAGGSDERVEAAARKAREANKRKRGTVKEEKTQEEESQAAAVNDLTQQQEEGQEAAQPAVKAARRSSQRGNA